MPNGNRKIQSVFELSDGSGMAVTVARYETPAHTDIDKVCVTSLHRVFYVLLKLGSVYTILHYLLWAT